MTYKSMPGFLINQKPKLANHCIVLLNIGGKPFQHFLCLFFLLLCFKACYATVGCIERERHALLQFKQDVIDDFGILSSWGNGEQKRNCCKWRGVLCSNKTAHVIMLDLHAETHEMGYFQSLRGKLGASLAELKHLQYMNLALNDFEGIVPIQLGNLSKLKFLDLSLNLALTCENLELFSGLPLLWMLDLSGVDLSKAIHWPQAISKMPSLTVLLLSDAQLPPIIPTSLSISHINSSSTSLDVLDLSRNGLTSSVYQWLFNFSASLVYLDLSHNDLNGSIPDSLRNMVFLESLVLTENRKLASENLDWLSGFPLLRKLDLGGVDLSKAIHWPQAISKMPSLTVLLLSDAQLPPIIPTSLSISHINSSSTSLDVLDLSRNGLTSSVYQWLFSFSASLVYLDLSHNDLNGSIPDDFGNLTALAYLDLSSNQLEGEIQKPLRSLRNLQRLYLSRNKLSELVEKDFLACFNNTLKFLDLSYNQLRGTSFPRLQGFSHLRKLDLGFNQLNGTLPESIGQLPQLQFLSIPSNSLQGILSENHLFGLSKLLYLDLSYNSLSFNITLDRVPQFQAEVIMLASCKLGPRFPHWLQTQKGLQKVDTSSSGISDVIPNWFWNLSANFVWLNFSNNDISGTLPNLQATPSGMDMSSNRLQGSIPQSFFNAGWLDLSKNMLSGSISLSNQSRTTDFLTHLDLSNNQLSGELPNHWEQWRYLIVLNLANNNFSGKIKNSVGLLYQIQSLHLRNNSLIGALPSSLEKCRDLQLIDIGRNKLSGKIPAWMGRSLINLTVLNLGSNEFNGGIPFDLCRLKRLQTLDLSRNNLSGFIPKCLNNLIALTQKGSSIISYEEGQFNAGWNFTYVDNTWIQWKGKEWEYKNTLGLVRSIDFSSNNLIGEIPVEITDLVKLVALNLSRNNLTGSIPPTIGQLKSLDSLDLSQNQLRGEIPTSLSEIAGLGVLDLSNNILSGKIPTGTQLQSFKDSTYEGNPGLCGPPLLKMCQEDEKDECGKVSFAGLCNTKDNIQDDASDILFYGNIVLGFVIGFWGVCGTLLLNPSWRHFYFHFLNKIKDWLQVTTTTSINRLKGNSQS